LPVNAARPESGIAIALILTGRTGSSDIAKNGIGMLKKSQKVPKDFIKMR
jgi:hypothetical protein